jgi:hypothetical protein
VERHAEVPHYSRSDTEEAIGRPFEVLTYITDETVALAPDDGRSP